MSHLQLVEKLPEELLIMPDDEPDRTWKQPHAKVRQALQTDAFGILDTLIDALNATELPLPDPVMPYAVQHMMDLIAREFVWVAEDHKGRIVGCLALNFGQWPWVPGHDRRGTHLFNEHFWVDPAFRKGGTALRFLALAKARATTLKLALMIELAFIDEGTKGRLSRKDRFVANQGFRYIGGKFYWTPGGDV
jgi:GNAT superfamily N-acetyltransferase